MMAHPDAASAAAPADARRVVRLIHADAPLPADCGAEALGSKAGTSRAWPRSACWCPQPS